MKIDRLIGIITILLQKDKVTIPQLAERFEVSSRTIQRDLDDLCKAGIPIVSMQGYDGGISVAKGYKLDKTILTTNELQVVLAGIKSIDSISKTSYRQTIIEKFSTDKDTLRAEQDVILIDLGAWDQEGITDKIEQIKQAVLHQEIISFLYHSNKGESKRRIEPYFIVFKWAAWYVYGYCLSRQDYRLFKLNRICQLARTATRYEPRRLPEGKLDLERYFRTEEMTLVALFEDTAKYRLIEEYGPECFTATESGKLLFQKSFTNPDYATQWILSFGDKVKVISPSELGADIYAQAKNILKQYE